MFLKNYTRYIRAITLGTWEDTFVDVTGATICINRVEGLNTGSLARTIHVETLYKRLLTALSATDCYGVCFGDGNTPVKETDFGLSGNIITNITMSVTTEPHTGIPGVEDESVARVKGRKATYTITNNNDEQVTIGEIMLVGSPTANHNGGTYHSLAIERTVLETPIVIPGKGGIGQVEYDIYADSLD